MLYYKFSCGHKFDETEVFIWRELPEATKDRIKKKRKKRYFSTIKYCPKCGDDLLRRERKCRHPGCHALIINMASHGNVAIRCDEHKKLVRRERTAVHNKKRTFKKTGTEVSRLPPKRYSDCINYEKCLWSCKNRMSCVGCAKYSKKQSCDYDIRPRETCDFYYRVSYVKEMGACQ